jgi:cytochrome c556
MRTYYWVFLFSLALVFGGVASAQQGAGSTTEDTRAAAPCQLPGAPAINTPATDTTGPSTMAPKAYVKDLMNYMVMPSASGVWNAVATSTDQTGVHESRPESDDDWNKVIAAATELVESTNLLMVAGRKRCVGGAIPEAFLTDWRRKAREVGEAANIALIVAKKHDADALGEAGERIDVACDQCHERYQLLDDDPTDNNAKVWGTWKPKAGSKAKPAVPPGATAASPAKTAGAGGKG